VQTEIVEGRPQQVEHGLVEEHVQRNNLLLFLCLLGSVGTTINPTLTCTHTHARTHTRTHTHTHAHTHTRMQPHTVKRWWPLLEEWILCAVPGGGPLLAPAEARSLGVDAPIALARRERRSAALVAGLGELPLVVVPSSCIVLSTTRGGPFACLSAVATAAPGVRSSLRLRLGLSHVAGEAHSWDMQCFC
jgi:hypothetical protein